MPIKHPVTKVIALVLSGAALAAAAQTSAQPEHWPREDPYLGSLFAADDLVLCLVQARPASA